MGNSEDKPNVTLETLLKLKRNERPHPEFWESFDRSFERRRLHALVEKRSFFEVAWPLALRALALGMPVFLFVGLAAVWWENEDKSSPETAAVHPEPLQISEAVADLPPLPAPRKATETSSVQVELAGTTSNQFVLDAFEDSAEHRLDFRKVLYTPAIRLSAPSGSLYVRDSFSAHNYGVTTADMRLGRNF